MKKLVVMMLLTISSMQAMGRDMDSVEHAGFSESLVKDNSGVQELGDPAVGSDTVGAQELIDGAYNKPKRSIQEPGCNTLLAMICLFLCPI